MEENSHKHPLVLNFFSVSTLKQITITKIVTLLWKQFDLKEAKEEYLSTIHIAFRDFPLSKNKTLFKVISKVSNNLSCLLLPQMLKQDASNVIRPIGLQMLDWIEKHADSYPAQNCTEFFWTPQGTVDKRRMTEALLEKYFIAVQRRTSLSDCQIKHHNCLMFFYPCFEIACEYCCEDYIFKLWDIAPSTERLSLRRNIYCYSGEDKNLLLIYWTYKLDGGDLDQIIKDYHMHPSQRNVIWASYGFDQCRNVPRCEILKSKLQSKNMFEWAIFNSNTTAVTYFWHQLTKEEIMKNIVSWTKNVIRMRKYDDYRYQYINSNTDVFCFLLSQMNKKQQKHVFKKYHNAILYALFIDWPWQNHVIPTIELMWNYLDGQAYTELLSKISCKLNLNNSVSEILKDLWERSPQNLRKYFLQTIEYNGGMDVLTRLFKIEDINTVKFILNDATAVEKKQILCSCQILSECRQIIFKHKWDLLQVFIEQTFSVDDLVVFKERLVTSKASYFCWKLINNDDWHLLNSFVSWCFPSRDAVDRFKKELLYNNGRNICCLLLNKLAGKGELQLLETDKYIRWSLSTDEEVQKFRKDLAYNEMKYIDVLVNSIAVDQTDELKLLKEFINWTFSSEEEVIQFKQDILRGKKKAKYVVKKMLMKNKPELADIFLQWCYPSEQAIAQCKNEIIFSKKEILDILYNQKNHCQREVPEFDEDQQKIKQWLIHNSFIKCNPSEL